MQLTWRGQGLEEQALDTRGRCVVAVDPHFFRPSDVEDVVGDASKARTKLGWRPKITFREIVAEMAMSDSQTAERERSVMGTTVQFQE